MSVSGRPRVRGRWNAIRHKAMVRGFSAWAPYFLVNEFPKSGGTWLALMLADLLELPFRRNQPILFEKSVTHGHFLGPLGLRNTVVMWRDPRDLLVSFYYHCYFVNEHQNAALVQLMKQRCPFEDYEDIRTNLPAFIRFVTKTPVSPSFSWPRFAATWAGRSGTVQTSYETLRSDTAIELARVAQALSGHSVNLEAARTVAEAHSFSKAKKRAESERSQMTELSFIREGSLGGWRKHFSAEADAALETGGYIGAMRILGYKTGANSGSEL